MFFSLDSIPPPAFALFLDLEKAAEGIGCRQACHCMEGAVTERAVICLESLALLRQHRIHNAHSLASIRLISLMKLPYSVFELETHTYTHR